MKSLFVVSDFYPRVGGGENYVLNFAKESVKAGHKITVIAPDELKKGEINIEGVSVLYRKYYKIFGNKIINPYLLYKTIKGGRYDSVYVSGPGIIDIFGVIIAKLFKIPVFTTYHADLDTNKLSSKIFTELYCKIIIKLFDHVIVTTNTYKEKLIKRGVIQEKISNIPVGFKSNDLNLKEIISKKIKNQILFVGALDTEHEYKNLNILIESMAHLEDFNLKIVGGGNKKSYYEDYAKNKKINNIEFLGKINNEELNNLYNKSRIFILPSNSNQEGFGIVLLEAIERGCYIITGLNAGGSFLIKNNKFLGEVYDGSTKDLVDKVLLSKNKDFYIDKTSSILKEFYWDKITKKIWNLLSNNNK